MSPQTPPRAAARPSAPESHVDHRTGLSFTQMAASAGAASSAAFAASYLGVAGTIIGAAVASVIATVATSMYTASLRRSREAVRRRAGQFVVVTRASPSMPTRPGGPAVIDLAPTSATPPAREGIRWGRIVPAAAVVLAITLGALTGLEGVLGKPLSALLGGSDATGTSLGAVGGSGSAENRQQKPTAPVTAPVAEPADTPTTDPTVVPTTTPTDAPATGPTTQPTDDPTNTPTADPTTEPTPSAGPTP